MDQVLVCGDFHGNLMHARSMVNIARAEKCDAMVQLGDFGWWPHDPEGQRYLAALERMGLRIYWLDGNHEDHDDLDSRPFILDDEGFRLLKRPNSKKYFQHLRHIPRGHRWTWENIRFMGFGGGASVDRSIRTPGFDWFPQEAATYAQINKVFESDEAVDVLFAHDTPLTWPTPRNEVMANLVNLEAAQIKYARDAMATIVEHVTPQLLMHGHMHVHKVYKYGAVDVTALPGDGKPNGIILTLNQEAENGE